jgi:hypothetical protein
VLEKGVMRRNRTVIQASLGVAAVAGGMVFFAPAAQAITIPVACSENALVAAVNLANSTPTSDTLVLAGGCTYRMTTSHGGTANALPVITTPTEMIGPATVTNASLLGLGLFRIAEVAPTGSLTLTTGVAFTRGNVLGDGGGIYNGLRGTLTVTGVSGSPLFITGNSAGRGGGISAVDSTATTLTQTAVTNNHALLLLGTAGGVYRHGGTITTTNSPITANTPDNCVGSVPAVPNCTG